MRAKGTAAASSDVAGLGRTFKDARRGGNRQTKCNRKTQNLKRRVIENKRSGNKTWRCAPPSAARIVRRASIIVQRSVLIAGLVRAGRFAGSERVGFRRRRRKTGRSRNREDCDDGHNDAQQFHQDMPFNRSPAGCKAAGQSAPHASLAPLYRPNVFRPAGPNRTTSYGVGEPPPIPGDPLGIPGTARPCADGRSANNRLIAGAGTWPSIAYSSTSDV